MLQAQKPTELPQRPAPDKGAVVEEPPEEDLSAAEKQVYVLNPLQSAKEMKIGQFYMKKGSYKAAARRFEEALKWDPNSADAAYQLGEADVKLGDRNAAKKAFETYLKLQPNGKQADSVRKKLALRTVAGK